MASRYNDSGFVSFFLFEETKQEQLSIKETILRKSEHQQKVLRFKKTSPFSQNLFIESRCLNGSTAPLATISVSKRFHSERI